MMFLIFREKKCIGKAKVDEINKQFLEYEKAQGVEYKEVKDDYLFSQEIDNLSLNENDEITVKTG